jgi:hypothetical protein
MADPYMRKCKFCGETIRMAQMDCGQWLPFEANGTGKHSCEAPAPKRQMPATSALSSPPPLRPARTVPAPFPDSYPAPRRTGGGLSWAIPLAVCLLLLFAYALSKLLP